LISLTLTIPLFWCIDADGRVPPSLQSSLEACVILEGQFFFIFFEMEG